MAEAIFKKNEKRKERARRRAAERKAVTPVRRVMIPPSLPIPPSQGEASVKIRPNTSGNWAFKGDMNQWICTCSKL